MVNALTLLIIVGIWLIAGYFIYGRFLERKLIKPNDKTKTPARLYEKQIDFKPTKKAFLFGHHFASIAGAGPIIGPILAVSYFGWLAVVLWIALGSVLIGAVHDYITLMLSVRNNGQGIAKLSEKITGKKTFYIFSILLWLTLMLIITVFSVSAADSLVNVPELVIPFFGITATAILLGFMIYKWKQNKTLSSIIAIALAIAFIFLGIYFPISLPFSLATSKIIWIAILFIYALIASLIPVWTLLQPRDYLSATSLFLFLGIGLISIIIARPVLNAPAIIPPAISNIPLWPILFITVACGAVSGFHALVSSGTTSKQLEKESDGKFIGYGAMLTEALVALLVVIFVSAGLGWNSSNGIIGQRILTLQSALNQGWIVAFGNGFANIVNSAIPFIPITLLIILGSLIVNIFILTSLDTSTRIGRMISSEMFSKKSKINNRFLLTLAILIPAFLLAITNSYSTMWKMFGASNQLIAGVVLVAISAYLIEHKKPSKYTIIPSIFMIITTLAALLYGIFNKTSGYLLSQSKSIPLTIISFILIIFALIVSYEIFIHIKKRLKRK